MKLLPHSLTLLLFLVFTQNSNAQLAINTDLTVEELVNDFFNSGDFIELSNITFNGGSANVVNTQIGLFSNANSEGFFMDAGLIMGTHNVHAILTDSVVPWTGVVQGSDSDMLEITGSSAINDCAILEFDVLVNAEAIAFNYSFGSVEYPGFTCSQFNDGFGFFVSGPGIDGPFSNSSVNIATIPESDVPVAINTINSGTASGVGSENICINANPNWIEDSVYFIDNNPSGTNSSINFPGYTVELEAFLEVVQGETYHFKLAICDVIDGALDSGIFLTEGSLEGRFPSNVNEISPSDFSLFPNPAQEAIRLSSSKMLGVNSTIRLYSAEGRLIRSEIANGNQDLIMSTGDLDRGIYLLEIQLDNQAPITKKFIKE